MLRSSLLLAVLVAVQACTCGRADAPSDPDPLDRTPAPIPEDWVYELVIPSDAALAAVRARMPEGRARAVVPARAVDFVDGVAPLSAALREAVSADSPLRCVALWDRAPSANSRLACALRGAGLPEGTPGAPRGAMWLELARGAGARAGDVVVVAPDRATVERALPYLAFTAMTDAVPAATRVRLAGDFAGNVLRPLLEGELARRAADARADADATALGEPEALVAAVQAALASRAELLADSGEIELSIEALERELVITARAEVRPDSPLARWLAAAEGGVRGLAELPIGTALAWASRLEPEARAAMASELLGALAPIAGDRLGAADRAALEAGIGAWAGARGETSVAAVVPAPEGLGVWLASAPVAGPLELAPVTSALSTPWARTVLGALAGCAELAPRLEGDRVALCPGAAISRAQTGDAVVLALESGPTGSAEYAGRLASGSAELGANPDVERALGDRGAFFVAIALPSALPATVARWAPSMGARAPAPRPAPVVLTAAENQGDLVVTLRGTTEALADLLALLDALAEA